MESFHGFMLQLPPLVLKLKYFQEHQGNTIAADDLAHFMAKPPAAIVFTGMIRSLSFIIRRDFKYQIAVLYLCQKCEYFFMSSQNNFVHKESSE